MIKKMQLKREGWPAGVILKKKQPCVKEKEQQPSNQCILFPKLHLLHTAGQPFVSQQYNSLNITFSKGR